MQSVTSSFRFTFSLSVRALSVRLACTLCCPIKTVQAKIRSRSLHFGLPQKLWFLVTKFCAAEWEDLSQTRASKRVLLKGRYFTAIGSLACKRLQIGTDLLLIITSTADEIFGDTNINNVERTWTAKIGGFSDILLFSAVTHIFRVNCTEIARDKPKQPRNAIFSIKHKF